MEEIRKEKNEEEDGKENEIDWKEERGKDGGKHIRYTGQHVMHYVVFFLFKV